MNCPDGWSLNDAHEIQRIRQAARPLEQIPYYEAQTGEYLFTHKDGIFLACIGTQFPGVYDTHQDVSPNMRGKAYKTMVRAFIAELWKINPNLSILYGCIEDGNRLAQMATTMLGFKRIGPTVIEKDGQNVTYTLYHMERPL